MEHTEDNGRASRNATVLFSVLTERNFTMKFAKCMLLPRMELKAFINFYICGSRRANWLHYAKENYLIVQTKNCRLRDGHYIEMMTH